MFVKQTIASQIFLWLREERAFQNGSTRQQPVTSYDVKNKSTELHLTSVAPLPLPSSSPFMLAQSLFLPFSIMLHPTDHE